MKKHGGVLPCRPETGDGEGRSGGGWPAGTAAHHAGTLIFLRFFFVSRLLLLPYSF